MRLADRSASDDGVDRREFLRCIGAACLGCAAARKEVSTSAPGVGQVMTVLGPISPAAFGSVLSHEHLLVDFVGAERIRPDTYDLDEAYRIALPHLRRARELGCRGFVDCTPAYLGRVPRLLRRLARSTGLHIVTNTGYYGAAADRFVPAHALRESEDALADRWVEEWRGGIDGTGIRPGVIKTGVDPGPLSSIDRKLVRAAARAHSRTGLTIASHTPDTRAAVAQIGVLAEEGIAPEAFIWVHAQNDWDVGSRADAARKGAWIEIDSVSGSTVDRCVERATELKRAGTLSRLLVSHDAGWYDPALAGGSSFRPFDTIYTAFVPALRRAGWTASDVRQVLAENPARAFTVHVRRDTAASGRSRSDLV